MTKPFSIEEKLVMQDNDIVVEQSSSKSKTTASDTLKLANKATVEWANIEPYFEGDGFELPDVINEAFAKAFLLRGTQQEDYAPSFGVAFCKMIDAYRAPLCLLEPYQRFFETFQPSTEHYTNNMLRNLYGIARQINASMKWMKYTLNPLAVMLKNGWHDTDNKIEVSRIFSEQKWLYSSKYFTIVDEIMESEIKCNCVVKSLECFFDLIQKQKNPDMVFDEHTLFCFNKVYQRFDEETLETYLLVWEAQARHSISNAHMIALFNYCHRYGYDIMKEIVVILKEDENIEDLGERVETLVAQKQKLQRQQQEQLVQQEKIDFRQRMVDEEQKKLKVEQELQRTKQLKEQEQKAEQDKQLQQQQFTTSLHQSFDLFAAQNQFQEEVFAKILSFTEDFQKIATTINKQLRPEQLVTLGLLVLSQTHTILIQLATGAGKSLMLGILAQYLNQTTGKKVVVVVPTSFLHAYQQHHYCSTACKIPEKMVDPDTKLVFYSDFNRFITPEFAIPADTILLIDEFHELFFDQQVQLVNGKVVSVISKLLSAAQVIGVSATYRAEAGIDKIISILKNSAFIKPPQQLQEKELQLEVFGRIPEQDIIPRVIALAQEKAKTMPVIIFSESLALKQQLPEAIVFAGNEVGELNALLKFCKTSSNTIILTTYLASKGVDFVFAAPQAFVIHTTLTKSLVQLKQDSGRGVRGNNLPIVGALFTERMYFSLEDVELGLSHSEQFDKLYPVDYLKSLQYLDRLPTPTTDPQTKVLEAAAVALNQGKSFVDICNILSKATAYKKNLPKSEFTVPAVKQSMLGKRKQQEEQKKDTNPSPPKQSTLVFNKKPVTQQKEEAKYAEQCFREHGTDIIMMRDCSFSQTTCRMCNGLISNEDCYHCSVCSCYYCSNCRVLDAGAKIADGNYTKTDMDIDDVPNQNLLPEVELDISMLEEPSTEFKANILKKMNEEDLKKMAKAQGKVVVSQEQWENMMAVGGTRTQQQQQKQVSSSENYSETSGAILFGNKNSSSPQKRKKRQQKQQEKQEHLEQMENQSVRSSESKNSRSTNGRFEGGTIFHGVAFKKKGLSNGGNQQWMCSSCRKKTTTPEQHKCQRK